MSKPLTEWRIASHRTAIRDAILKFEAARDAHEAFFPDCNPDADAFEMAQPEPWKLISLMTSPSMRAKIVYWSPQRGLWPCAVRFAPSSLWKLRGLRLWSRITC